MRYRSDSNQALVQFSPSSPPPGFYVYAYLRAEASERAPKGSPWYIGKGIDQRAWLLHKRHSGKHFSPPPEDQILILKWGLSEADAYEAERRLVDFYGGAWKADGWLRQNLREGGLGGPSEALRENLIGQRFGRLIVEKFGGKQKGSTMWTCQCDCGKKSKVAASNLKKGTTKSCGCQMNAASIERSTKHGHKTRNNASPTYDAWRNMRIRLKKEGAFVDKRWDLFENFLADLGAKPKGHFLWIKDKSKGMAPGNLLWAEGLGGSKTVLIINGYAATPTAWSRRMNMSYEAARGKVRRGKTWAQALGLEKSASAA